MAKVIPFGEVFQAKPAAEVVPFEDVFAGGGERASLADTAAMEKSAKIKASRKELTGGPVEALSIAAGTAANVSDMFTGVGKGLLGSAVYWGANASVLATTGDKKTAATAASMAKDHFFPPEVSAPWGVVASSLGKEAQKAYEDNPVAWIMGNIGKFIDEGGKKTETRLGIPAEHFAALADQFMNSLGWTAIRPGIREAFKTRTEQLKIPSPNDFVQDDFPKPHGRTAPADMAVEAGKPHLKPKSTAEQIGLPPATQRGSIDPELAKAMALSGGGAAIGAALDEEEPLRGAAAGAMAPLAPKALNRLAEGPVGAGAEIGAVKPPGGMWHPETMERLSEPLFRKMRRGDFFRNDLLLPDEQLIRGETESGALPNQGRAELIEDLKHDRAINAWSDKTIRNYLNRFAGTAGDPLKYIVLPSGKRWEEVTDQAIGNRPAKDYGKGGSQGALPGLNKLKAEGKVPLDEPIYQLGGTFARQFGHQGENVGGSVKELTDYISHAGDFARQNIPPEKLSQYDFVRLIKETSKNDERVAKEMAKAASDETKGLPVYKEYPEGMKWVELKKPEKLTAEQAKRVKTRDELEFDPSGQKAFVGGDPQHGYFPVDEKGNAIKNSYTQDIASGRTPEEAHLAGQLAREGNQMGHCVGGYCEGVASGESRIFSLRDSKGQSHVTIEVEPRTHRFKGDGAGSTVGGMGVLEDIPSIIQIKGKQNRAPVSTYQPYVQDFVRSAKWGEVGDLENTGLTNEHQRFKVSNLRDNLKQSLPEADKLFEEPFITQEQWEWLASGGRTGSQKGSADISLLAKVGLGATGAALGAAADSENPKTGAIIGGLLGLGAASAPWGKVLKGADYGLGILSTRIRNISPAVHHRAVEFERNVLQRTHERVSAVTPFLVALNKVPAAARGTLNRALLTNDSAAVDTALAEINDSKLTTGWQAVRQTLVSTGIALADAGRFKMREDYFPRIVKDRAGLLESIGRAERTGLETALEKAELAAMKSRGTGLTAMEESNIINEHLLQPQRSSNQPGFAKSRRIGEITEKLEPFYHNPTDSLHAYLREATKDLEKAKFFGRERVDTEAGGKKYINVEASIGAVVQKELDSKRIDFSQAKELTSLLRSRLEGGERQATGLVADAKNLANMGLLGNVVSAAAQLGDPVISVFTQGLKPTLVSVAQNLAGRASLKMKDFGLVDHISEEFVTTRRTADWLNKSFKYGGFAWADAFGKNVTLNAARDRFEALARTSKGSAKISRMYRESFGSETPQLITDLKAKKLTDLTRSLYFHELSNMQPISKIEMPQAYLDNPNGRVFYMLKSFALKQADVARREGYNEIKKGNLAKGLGNLAAYGTALGVAGATTQMIQDWMLGKPADAKWADIPMNLLKTFGWSQYVIDKARSGHPIEAAANVAIPPYKMFEEILRRDPSAIKYIPIVGKLWWAHSEEGKKAAEKQRKAEEGREISREGTPFWRKKTQEDVENVRERRRMLREMRGISAADGKAGLLYSDTPGRGITNKVQEANAQIQKILSVREPPGASTLGVHRAWSERKKRISM